MSAPQGTEEWRRERCGKVTASRVADVAAKTKTGYGASRANYMAELVLERLTGVPFNGYESQAMREGREREPLARSAYEFMTDRAVALVGFVAHPFIANCGASPDGLVGDSGLVEIKSPQPAAHLETVLTERIDDKYIKQMQFQMACTGREWCDFVSWSPDFPPAMQFFVKRLERNPTLIGDLEEETELFLAEIERKVQWLRNRYELAEAA